MSVDVSNALLIPGWTNEAELTWLAEQASMRQTIVEVGCWKGRSTRALADNTPGIVHAVDTWLGTREDGHSLELYDKSVGWLYSEFCRNIDGVRDRVYPWNMHSVRAAKFIPEGVDMVFIDAAHDYENVKADILAWRPLLAPGGLLCGHDYDAGRPGVVKAVRELIPERKRGPGSIWIAA